MIDIYYTDIRKLKNKTEHYLGGISDYRKSKISKLKQPSDRLLCLCAGLLVEKLVGDEDNAIVGKHGKPYIPNKKHYNISHSGDYAIISVGGLPLGCDIEKKRDIADIHKLAQRVLCDSELSALKISDNPTELFFKYWTVKEAYTKMLGAGISSPFREIEATVSDNNASIIGDTCHILLENLHGYQLCVCGKEPINKNITEILF